MSASKRDPPADGADRTTNLPTQHAGHSTESDRTCAVCHIKFHTHHAYESHIQKSHGAQQDLQCPTCGLHFNRVGGLMGHIESQACKKGRGSNYMLEKRHEKVAFAQALQSKDVEGVYVNPSKHHGNFGAYIGVKTNAPITDTLSALAISDPVDSAAAAREAYRQGDSKQRDLLTEENLASMDKGGNPWETSKTLFPDTEPAPPPAKTLLPANQLPVTQPAVTIDPDKGKDPMFGPHHPNHPAFKTATYYVAVLQKYKCPHDRCNKSFKTPGSFIAHLQSPTHTSANYTCPKCHRHFKSTTALVQHTEAQGACRVQQTNQFRQYLDQLTGGIVDMEGDQDDATPRYVVTDQAKRDLAGGGNPPGIAASGLQNRYMQASETLEAEKQKKKEDAQDHQGW